jgi:hypothetical protein
LNTTGGKTLGKILNLSSGCGITVAGTRGDFHPTAHPVCFI